MSYAVNALASSDASINVSVDNFQPCTIDITTPTGIDIADHFESWIRYPNTTTQANPMHGYPDPFEFYTSTDLINAGVTLPGPDRAKSCSWKTSSNTISYI